jgi:3-phosphoshikimate 1-carboxyvinyltransferase
MDVIVNPSKNGIRGKFRVPGDKSISHRAAALSALAGGVSEIGGFLAGEDCLSTIACVKKLGAQVERRGDTLRVCGAGPRGLTRPESTLYAGNSGTTIRVMSGILAGQNFDSRIDGDESIRRRPMDRVIEPLTLMGARISGEGGKFAPLRIKGSPLRGVTYEAPVASAQVKSAILLAGLYADSPTTVIEKIKTRDHTEIMLAAMGAKISSAGGAITIEPAERLRAGRFDVPGDISSAAFLIVAALILPGSEIVIENVGANPTRAGILDALSAMGADIEISGRRAAGGEASADISAKSSSLKAIEIGGEIIPNIIDEIPILAVAALFAEGETVVKDAAELRVKESDRIAVMTSELRNMGADIRETPDGMIITGGGPLRGAAVESRKDHRAAMSLAVAALAASGETVIKDAECVNISYPGFFETLRS